LGSLGIIFYNEGRAVARTKALNEGQSIVRELKDDAPAEANEGALVYLSGSATTDETLEDPLFDVSAQAIHLARHVEMYQWEEKSKKRNDRTEYSYEKVWSDDVINSGSFEDKRHENPVEMPFTSNTESAQVVALGGFSLSEDLLSQMSDYAPIKVESEDLPEVPGMKRTVRGNSILYRSGGESPEIGDLNVTFTVVKPSTISVVAKQQGGVLSTYQTTGGGTIALLGSGKQSSTDLFAQAQADNALLTWMLRGGGTFLMFIGLLCLSAPITWLARWVPLLGSIVEAGVLIISLFLTAAISALAIGLSWLAVRPVLALALFAAAIALVFALRRSGKRASARVAAMPPPPPPPSAG